MEQEISQEELKKKEEKERRRLEEQKKAVAEKTAKNKALFLQYFEQVKIVSMVCEKVGIGRSTINSWRKTDKEFNERYNEIEQNRHYEVRDRLFQLIRKNDKTAIMFYLSRRDPEYKLKSESSLTLNTPVEKEINNFLEKTHARYNQLEAAIKKLEAEGEPGRDRGNAENQEQKGTDSAVSGQPSSEVVLAKQDASKPDTQSPAGGNK